MLLASSPSRIAGLDAAATRDGGVAASWTPSPEKASPAISVTWGPADNPARTTLRVTQPKAPLPGAGPAASSA